MKGFTAGLQAQKAAVNRLTVYQLFREWLFAHEEGLCSAARLRQLHSSPGHSSRGPTWLILLSPLKIAPLKSLDKEASA